MFSGLAWKEHASVNNVEPAKSWTGGQAVAVIPVGPTRRGPFSLPGEGQYPKTQTETPADRWIHQFL